jgi:hypothetical protein
MENIFIKIKKALNGEVVTFDASEKAAFKEWYQTTMHSNGLQIRNIRWSCCPLDRFREIERFIPVAKTAVTKPAVKRTRTIKKK